MSSEEDLVFEDIVYDREGISHMIMKNIRQQIAEDDETADNEHILEGLKEKYRSMVPVN